MEGLELGEEGVDFFARIPLRRREEGGEIRTFAGPEKGRSGCAYMAEKEVVTSQVEEWNPGLQCNDERCGWYQLNNALLTCVIVAVAVAGTRRLTWRRRTQDKETKTWEL